MIQFIIGVYVGVVISLALIALVSASREDEDGIRDKRK